MRQSYPKLLPISLAPWTGCLRISAHAGKSTSKRPATAAYVLVDAGFLVALRDAHQARAIVQPQRFLPPWKTCEAALSEAFHLPGPPGAPALATLRRRRAVVSAFHLGEEPKEVLELIRKYADVPMSLADACLVRVTEIRPTPFSSPPTRTSASAAATAAGPFLACCRIDCRQLGA
jgi:hypothetical protein